MSSHEPSASAARKSAEMLQREARQRWITAGFDTRLIAVDGTTLHVAMGGEGAPVLLLHGYPQSGEIWRKLSANLMGKHRVIIPDLPGMGLSDPISGRHTVLAAADALDALLRSLGTSQIAVVGHDWGGAVGATLALAHPDRVSRLAFIESALAGAGFEAIWRFDAPNPKLAFIPFLLIEGLAESLVAGREEVFLHWLWDVFTADKQAAPFSDWVPYVEAVQQPGRFASSADYYRAIYQSAEESKRLLAAGKLTVPVLPISGERSFGEANAAMAGNFASDVLPGVVLSGAGHFVPEERPFELRDALRDFLV